MAKSDKNLTQKITPALEDYLESLFFLSQNVGGVRVTDLADKMNVSKPGVNKAMNVLKASGYVEHEHYGSLTLTESGEELARSIANRHRVLTVFFEDILNVSGEIARIDACKIEHSLSHETFEKLEFFVDNYLSLM